ncbi:hypothetical protein E8E12_009969 [Didymella heteroderae]|uniref:BZIP domain-containing protein n=1 Tax=Didymella heteroderae TaxID=1769908 RepID=A0A9P5C3C5_9PLEO|nr:hypothetical protein E8E12_009969 [Didymella heteroderae]
MVVNIQHPYSSGNTGMFALNDVSSTNHFQDWHIFSAGLDYIPIIDSSYLAQQTFKQNEQPHSPEGSWNTSRIRDSAREASVPVDQLKNEVLWPGQRSSVSKTPQTSLPIARKTTEIAENPLSPVINVEPVKRKRGRPRLEPPYLNPHKASASTNSDQPTRVSQLEKNRIAADKCRHQRKESTSKLIAQHSSLSAKNAALKADLALLREQVLELKHEVLKHAKCGAWMIDSYVTRIAGDLCNGDMPAAKISSPSISAKTPVATDTGGAGSNDALESDPEENDGDLEFAPHDRDGLWFLDYDPVIADQQDP